MAHSTLHLALAVSLLTAACNASPSSRSARRAALVTDEFDVLDPGAERRIGAYLDWVRGQRGIDYRVVVDARGGGSPAERSSRLFEERDIGAETDGQGLLLYIDPIQRAVRVEVGYALEPRLTDVDASRMLADYLAPYFGSGETARGIEASIEALTDKIAASTETASSEVALAMGSGGAGASLDLLRALPDEVLDPETKTALQQILVPQPDPRQARDLELALLHKGLYLQDAALYDEDWRRAAKPAAWSPARLREIARQWDRPYELLIEEPLAVAYYPDAPALGPTFLRRVPEGWIIDASQGARSIVYDYSNQAWYALDIDSPYLALLGRALPLDRVTLSGGRRAWRMKQPRR